MLLYFGNNRRNIIAQSFYLQIDLLRICYDQTYLLSFFLLNALSCGCHHDLITLRLMLGNFCFLFDVNFHALPLFSVIRVFPHLLFFNKGWSNFLELNVSDGLLILYRLGKILSFKMLILDLFQVITYHYL